MCGSFCHHNVTVGLRVMLHHITALCDDCVKCKWDIKHCHIRDRIQKACKLHTFYYFSIHTKSPNPVTGFSRPALAIRCSWVSCYKNSHTEKQFISVLNLFSLHEFPPRVSDIWIFHHPHVQLSSQCDLSIVWLLRRALSAVLNNPTLTYINK